MLKDNLLNRCNQFLIGRKVESEGDEVNAIPTWWSSLCNFVCLCLNKVNNFSFI